MPGWKMEKTSSIPFYVLLPTMGVHPVRDWAPGLTFAFVAGSK